MSLKKQLVVLYKNIFVKFVKRKHISMVKFSGLFNVEYYLENNPDVKESGLNPILHFIDSGGFEGRNPSESFDIQYYTKNNPVVLRDGINPLIHYILFGRAEGKQILDDNKSISTEQVITFKQEYDKNSYEDDLKIIQESGLFDEDYYLKTYPDVKDSDISAIEHYYLQGWKEERNPGLDFDGVFYLKTYSDVREQYINPLIHYLKTGKSEGRQCKYKHKNTYDLGDSFEPALESDFDFNKTSLKYVAFYLPQFHPIPENDKWWGKGFTEWDNVVRAKPQFEGHYQPHLPIDIGFYDLRVPEVMSQQIDMAKSFGIKAFCFYYYWFDGKRLLEKPLDMFLKHKEWDIEFCVCWANENWSRRWDGSEDDILIAQNHSPEDDMKFIKDYSKYTRDSRYIRINNKAIIIIYRPDIIPNIKDSVKRWKKYYFETYNEELLFAMVQTFGNFNPYEFGFDYAIEFPPHNIGTEELSKQYEIYNTFTGRINNTDDLIENAKAKLSSIDYKLFRGVMLSWDNTARKNTNAHIYVNSEPNKYKEWLKEASVDTLNNKTNPEEHLVFINAWNEWAEGTHLEPDEKNGYSYLNATQRVLEELTSMNSRLPGNKNIVFVSHDAYFAGAQLVLRDIVDWLFDNTSIRIKLIFLADGELRSYFEKKFKCIFLNDFKDTSDYQKALDDFIDKDTDLVYLNSVASGRFLSFLESADIPVLTHVHELQNSIDIYASNYIKDIIDRSNHYIACSDAVEENLVANYELKQENISTIHAFVHNLCENKPDLNTVNKLKEKLNLPHDKKIVFAMGLGLFWRKGADLFIDVCDFVNQNYDLNDVVFVWIGGDFEDGNVKDYGSWENHLDRIRELGLDDKIIFLGKKSNVREYLKCGDVFLLPSREDPFPLVCLEAADCFLPTICFEKAGGMPEFVKDDAGFVVPFCDTKEMAVKTIELLKNSEEKEKRGKIAHDRFVQKYSAKAVLPKILESIRKVSDIRPLVSIIVPNYNYARYLDKRLETIYNQTFKDFEVIILDDASTDDSLAVIEKYSKYPETVVINNDVNSGSVIHQWEKGVKMAKGEYIWIAEADDFSHPEFLENLLPLFNNTDVNLAYCNSNAVDDEGVITEDFYINCNYYEGLAYKSSRWKNDYSNTGIDEISNVLAIKNTIPNCSAVVFRKKVFLEIDFSFIKELNCSHDWLTYIMLIKDGMISYCSETLNYHRRHNESVIALNASDHNKTVREYFLSHKYILDNFEVSSEVFSKMKDVIFKDLIRLWDDIDEEMLLKLYNVEGLNELIK